ncbi:MAG: phenylacetate--CoA ligase [Armatimonadetes bacterium]|nr:MAG: phenylacetate--CoA ligase [Armatimonadota bacterium]
MYQPEIETMPKGDKRRLQTARLVDLVDRLKASEVPYWREKMAGVGEIASIDDITKLPFTVKSEMRNAFPYGMLTVPVSACNRVHASSGTSGKPTIVAYTKNDLAVFSEVNARVLGCAGARANDVFHNAHGYGLFTGGLGLHGGAELFGVTVVPASGGNTAFQVELLADLGARGFCATPSFSLLLAERAEEAGLMDRIKVEYGIHGAEPWSESMRAKIEAAWGIDALDVYGLSEIIGPGVAMESVEGKGAPFIFDDHFYPEIVDPKTGNPVEDGVYGELVITTLTKEALPVVRYRTGDITRLINEPAACGRTFQRMDRIAGRADDMLIIRGINVFPSEIESMILAEPGVSGQWAIVLDKRGTMVEMVVRCELAGAESMPQRDNIRARLETGLHSRLRSRTSVLVGDPGSMPRSEAGKARRVFEQIDERDPLMVG